MYPAGGGAMKTVKVGRFEFESGTVSGPARYMEEKGNALISAIEKGEDMIFSMTAHYSPDVVTAILVRLQTDFAGWQGMKQMEGWIHSAKKEG
jgi:hypothetical protein